MLDSDLVVAKRVAIQNVELIPRLAKVLMAARSRVTLLKQGSCEAKMLNVTYEGRLEVRTGSCKNPTWALQKR